MAIERFG